VSQKDYLWDKRNWETIKEPTSEMYDLARRYLIRCNAQDLFGILGL